MIKEGFGTTGRTADTIFYSKADGIFEKNAFKMFSDGLSNIKAAELLECSWNEVKYLRNKYNRRCANVKRTCVTGSL